MTKETLLLEYVNVTVDDVWHKKGVGVLEVNMTVDMYDRHRIEVFMHDVRMQLVNVFMWMCLVGGWVRRVGAIQGSMFFCSQDWSFHVADRCVRLQLFSVLSGWSPHAWLLLLASPPCVAWSMHVLWCRSSHWCFLCHSIMRYSQMSHLEGGVEPQYWRSVCVLRWGREFLWQESHNLNVRWHLQV